MPKTIISKVIKFSLAFIHTVVGVLFAYTIGFGFVWILSDYRWKITSLSPWSYFIALSLIVIAVSVIATWVYAIKQNTSSFLKIIAFTAIPLYLYFGYPYITHYFTEPAYCHEVVLTKQGKQLLCTNEKGEQYYKELKGDFW